MERTQIFELMGELKLYGMKAAFDEIMTPRGSVKIPRVWSLEIPPPDDRRQRH